MATTDEPHVSDKADHAEGLNGVQGGVGAQRSEGSSTKPADEAPASSSDKQTSKDASPARPDSSSGMAAARGNTVNGSAPGAAGTPTISMPHPKKFSHVDINKRFLGKNSPSASIANATSPSNAGKAGSSMRT